MNGPIYRNWPNWFACRYVRSSLSMIFFSRSKKTKYYQKTEKTFWWYFFFSLWLRCCVRQKRGRRRTLSIFSSVSKQETNDETEVYRGFFWKKVVWQQQYFQKCHINYMCAPTCVVLHYIRGEIVSWMITRAPIVHIYYGSETSKQYAAFLSITTVEHYGKAAGLLILPVRMGPNCRIPFPDMRILALFIIRYCIQLHDHDLCNR
jgi:hypothetical protein